MLLLSHDAGHAKDLADKDLRVYESQLTQLRENRMQDIQKQKKAVEGRIKKIEQMNKNSKG